MSIYIIQTEKYLDSNHLKKKMNYDAKESSTKKILIKLID